ncbi:hypothetical protein FHS18_001607 [Paenibacillus phyllosphaerae]|uniref:Beta-galactosidase n=1 Tax=Paenibacillus phyllosphaerae TaxID=274593 RepID=A0A7W5FM24_9BACL|nr:beta-galactosidase [Paenibacillus phyllosphaerae]MBB3109544.1 hypothetical protein [Paenibacillus phyllosphaerae]
MTYSIQVKNIRKAIYPSTMRLGGSNPQGERISFTNYYMERDGEPFFAICGEFHYSRYPEADWETELAKMKLSGINVIPTYIFWNHHEEVEGAFAWEGNRNLRQFVELCGQQGLAVILRIGPFCHGEVRNGGLPDWLFGRSFDVRSNDEGYLSYVGRLYEEIGKQAAGLLYQEGGPVIGIQLENEFNAAAALWELTAKQGDEYLSGGSGGAEHIMRLKELAKQAGLVAPIYSITGWGNAPVPVDEVLPLYGGYAYTPWTISKDNPEQKPTGEYLFTSYHDDAVAARDFDPPYDRTAYPFACCEMGGGMQTWYLARFQVEPESVLAMSLVKIASGCNFIGYYMFHGGTNPVGETGFLNESTTPRITYDFQAPIGEFGQIRRSNHLLRPLHYFLQQFGGVIAPMATVLPEDAPSLEPEHAGSLRYAVRTDGRSGFVFVNNYQDHVEMQEHADVRFAIELEDKIVQFPRKKPLTVKKNASFFLPFNFDLGGVNLLSATAQPVTSQATEAVDTYFFLMQEGTDGEFILDGKGIASIETQEGEVAQEDGGEYCVVVPSHRPSMIRIHRADGTEVPIYAMTAAEAATLWEAELNGERCVLFSETPIVPTAAGFDLLGPRSGAFNFRIYTGGQQGHVNWQPNNADVRLAVQQQEWFTAYQVTCPTKQIELDVKRIHDHKVAIRLHADMFDGLEDLILNIAYTGNVGYAFSGGRLIHDHFHNGAPWEMGLSRLIDHVQDGEIVLETTPLRTGAATFAADAAMAAELQFDGQQTAIFHQITAEPVYRISLHPEQNQ